MSDKLKSRVKETSYQLSGRHNRNFMSGRIVSLIRGNDHNSHFSPQELLTIESVLRDDMATNPWLLNLCKAITDESVFVTKEELEIYNKHNTEGQEISISQSKVDEMREELDFLKERKDTLEYIFSDLTNKLDTYRKNGLNCGSNDKSIDNWIHMRIKLKESLEILTNDLRSDVTVEEPQSVVDRVNTKVNDLLTAIDTKETTDDWLDRQLDGLTVTEESKIQVLESINRQLFLRLEDIHQNLNELLKECLRIKIFYEKNVKEEMSWRTDVYSLIAHLQQLNSETKTLFLTESHSNDFVAKKCLIDEYSKIFGRVEKQESDEMQNLIDQLTRRIDILSDTKN